MNSQDLKKQIAKAAFEKAKQAAASSNKAVVCPFCQPRRRIAALFFLFDLAFTLLDLKPVVAVDSSISLAYREGSLSSWRPVPCCDRARE